jgi:hypothetical protein
VALNPIVQVDRGADLVWASAKTSSTNPGEARYVSEGPELPFPQRHLAAFSGMRRYRPWIPEPGIPADPGFHEVTVEADESSSGHERREQAEPPLPGRAVEPVRARQPASPDRAAAVTWR